MDDQPDRVDRAVDRLAASPRSRTTARVVRKILDDDAFQAVVMNHYLRRVFERANTEAPGVGP